MPIVGSKVKAGGAFKVADASDIEETADAKVLTGAERSDIAAGLRQRKEISAGYDEPIFGFKSLTGRFVGLMRRDGRLVQPKADGTYEPVVSPSNRWGVRNLSLGVRDGEKVSRVSAAEGGWTVEMFGAGGAHWVATEDGRMVRANAGWFLDRENIRGRRALGLGMYEGEMIRRVAHGPDGRVVEAWGENGGHWVTSPTGLVRPNKSAFLDKDSVRGARSVSIGIVDGEKIVRVQHDAAGRVVEAWGINGGHFVETPTGLSRANASKFAAATQAPIITYTGQAFATGAQELLFRPDQAVAYIFIEFGQSNVDGDNSNTADTLVSGVSLYPQNALMLAGTQGPRAQAIAGTATLVPLVEVNASASKRETPISGWVNHFIRDYYAAWNAYPTVVGMTAAFGGRPYVGNNRGQVYWRAAEKALTLAAQALKARGFASVEVVIGYGGSESDTDLARMTDTRFANQMRQFRRFASDLVRQAVNPLADPPVLFIQPSNVRNSNAWFQPVRDTMVRLDREQGFTFAGSAYHAEMEALLGDNSNLASSVIHRSNLGKYTTGQILARATMHEVLGATWHGIKPVRAYFQSAAVIAIEFDAMGDALVLDTSDAEVKTAGLANHGFVFDDGSGSPPAISSVAVSGLTATITLASAPTGPRKRIGYALSRSAGGPSTNQDGPIYGARGTLRDNAGHTRISDGSTQYDWCPAFLLNL